MTREMTFKSLALHWPWLGLVTLHFLAFSVSAHVMTHHQETRLHDSVVRAALGEGQLILSRYCYDKADQYLHAGVPHLKKKAFSGSFYQKILSHTAPTKHVHIHGAEVEEIIPWLWLALQGDPGNLELYLTSAFWLENKAGRPDVAMRVLNEAQRSLPFNESVQLEKGRIALKSGRINEAATAFDAGIRFAEMPDKKTEPLIHARLLLYRALIHESKGERQQAIDLLKKYMEVLPHDPNIRSRLAELQDNTAPPLSASSFWKKIMSQEDKQRNICSKQEESHNHDHHHEHD